MAHINTNELGKTKGFKIVATTFTPDTPLRSKPDWADRTPTLHTRTSETGAHPKFDLRKAIASQLAMPHIGVVEIDNTIDVGGDPIQYIITPNMCPDDDTPLKNNTVMDLLFDFMVANHKADGGDKFKWEFYLDVGFAHDAIGFVPITNMEPSAYLDLTQGYEQVRRA